MENKSIVSNRVKLEDRLIREFSFDDKVISTLFSDEEAFGICGGIVDKEARKVWKQNQFGKETKADIFTAHQTSMRLVEEAGIDTVSMLLTLPPLPFGIGNSSKAFQVFDNLNKGKNRPCIRLVDKTGVRYSIAFNFRTEISYRKTVEKGGFSGDIIWETHRNVPVKNDIFDFDTLVIKSDGVKIGELTRSGNFTPAKEGAVTILVVRLIKRFLNNPQKEFIYYGTETGQCSNCNRHISDRRSVAIAIGPICARNLGLRWG